MGFDDNLDIKLIRYVRDNPALYDHNDVHYMDFDSREVIWHKIGDELKRPAGDCKARWINIRDTNRRILRKRIQNPNLKIRPYKYDAELHFMRPFYRDILIANQEQEYHSSSDNEEAVVGGTRVDSSDESSDKKPLRKKTRRGRPPKSSYKTSKKKVRQLTEVPVVSVGMNSLGGMTAMSDIPSTSEFNVADPVDAFLLSIGATLKTFSPYHLNVAKSKIFAVVQEHDLQQVVQKESYENMQLDTKTPRE